MFSYKEKFDLLIKKKMSMMKGSNSKILTPAKYASLIRDVQAAKSKTKKKTSKGYRRLDKYSTLDVEGETKLIASLEEGDQVRFYVHTESLFDACKDVHNQT
ncbi:KRAB-A domain-containing protein 2 [Frankliniella fusca]|uniref:KRAB-A domain-containing protein 2 n=1 Tax=Frankliniella fusca TaxID=407009 RepID=A0AAE1GYS3_9NEOP|nr:KRAB-A domain-containing protein 2 [Frankliniella fusca]